MGADEEPGKHPDLALEDEAPDLSQSPSPELLADVPVRSGAPPLLRRVEGRFFRSVLATRLGKILDPPDPHSAGRYHRPGERILYTSATFESAVAAISGYMRQDGLPRMMVPLRIGEVFVLDQHDEEICKVFGIERDRSNESWQAAIAEGHEPASWRNADIARAAGAGGIIDRSRKMPGAWHLNLFYWNESGGPSVEICGEPVEILASADGPTWDRSRTD